MVFPLAAGVQDPLRLPPAPASPVYAACRVCQAFTAWHLLPPMSAHPAPGVGLRVPRKSCVICAQPGMNAGKP